MFAFRKKNKKNEKIDHLLGLVKKDPYSAKNRLRLADLYLRAGDKKSAIHEYQLAAAYLREEGFNLKAISIYKKLFTLDGMSLSDYKSLASIYAESGLFAEAKRTYEKILQMKPQDREILQALKQLERGDEVLLDRETKSGIEDLETLAASDADAVPIETLLAPSHGQQAQPDPFSDQQPGMQEEVDRDHLFADPQLAQGAIFPGFEAEFHTGITDSQTDDQLATSPSLPEEIPDITDPLQGKLLRDLDPSDLSIDREAAEEDLLTNKEEESRPEIAELQTRDSHTTSPSLSEEILNFTHSPRGNTDPDPTVDPMETTFTPPEETLVHPPDTDTFDSTEAAAFAASEASPGHSSKDPDLHYHLGVAYREMDLTDRAIEEFTKALEEGSKPLECLIMLAKCYSEKGLFQEAAGLIHRALKLENLNQDQIDQLHRQLEEAEAVGKLA